MRTKEKTNGKGKTVKKPKKRKINAETKTKRRLGFLVLMCTAIFVGLLVRIAYIQFVMGEELQKQAYRQQNTGRLISPLRGNIYDRTGKELAISVAVDNITVSPKIIRNNINIEPAEIADKLSEILGFGKEAILVKLVRDSEFEIIARKADREKGDAVRKWISEDNVKGIYVNGDTKRYYPNDNLASHIVGFTGADNQGLYGLEAVMEEYLKGSPGKIITEVDKGGTELPFSKNTEIAADNGNNLVLTIDSSIQLIVEEILQKGLDDNKVARGGSVIVSDSQTGEILAMASKPDFNLNQPRANPPGYESADWTGYTEEDTMLLARTVWRNKAVSDTYEPGSTFKAVTTSIALENNTLKLDDMVDDYPVEVQEHKIYCWSKKYPHGVETFLQAIYNSCNPVFVKVAQELGVTKFYEYVELFGFKEKTGISLAGEENSVFHKHPTEIDLAVASFGQRFTVTPLQMVMAYNAIANGGYLMKPMLVREITDDDGNTLKTFQPTVVRQVISNKTSETVRGVLEGVVSEGTGKNAFVPGYRVAGKTGTSETTEEDRYIASFCGFAPANKPLITVLVILDDPRGDSVYGGTIAAPMVGDIIEKTLEYMQINREGDEEYMEKQVMVPDVTGHSMEEAIKNIKSLGLEYIIEGDETGEDLAVVYQNPKAGEVVNEKSVVILYKALPGEKTTVKMPNLLNKSIGEAKSALHNLGINIIIDGAGVCISQEYIAGALLEMGSVVEVKFRYLDSVH